LGTLSHYIIFITLICVGCIIAVLTEWPLMIPVLVYGACAHVIFNTLFKKFNPLTPLSADPDSDQ
jgi:hypothetical protein